MLKSVFLLLLLAVVLVTCGEAYDFTFRSQKLLLKTLSILVADLINNGKPLDWKDVMYWSGESSLHDVRHNLEYLPPVYEQHTS